MARKRKKSSGMRKGSAFERKICKMLSLWWTRGKRDDVFWRTSGSGSRATTRSKQGKDTHGQYGDIQAVDPIGKPLTDLVVIEVKCGYKKGSLAHLVEQWSNEKKPCLFEKFIRQAEEAAVAKGLDWDDWILFIKQDYKPLMVITSDYIWSSVRRPHSSGAGIIFFGRTNLPFADREIVILTWERFKQLASRRRIRKWANMTS